MRTKALKKIENIPHDVRQDDIKKTYSLKYKSDFKRIELPSYKQKLKITHRAMSSDRIENRNKDIMSNIYEISKNDFYKQQERTVNDYTSSVNLNKESAENTFKPSVTNLDYI